MKSSPTAVASPAPALDQGAVAALREYPGADAAAAALAAEVAARLGAALASAGTASLVVSGGRSPIAFFHTLSAAPLDWARVTVTLADERWVDPGAEASNERVLREHLLRGPGAAARLLPLKSATATPEAALAERSTALAEVLRGADVLVLGMGHDGHTASLFPDADGIEAALDPRAAPALVAMHPTLAPHARISMNLAALVAARHAVLLLGGATKREVLARACPPGTLAALPPGALPIAAVWHHRRGALDIVWSN
ncbi:6-phosphogluconolactonase [Rivibacter subsaxonicus]|uniref:6-phosphogluconolactonase n=1 Tax=Rivibacter subsaxonicus TaxID=457575 RepID=A0A4Q7V8F9_9BURK|nr:6-phosphogluconolactonase [Rivibacter subsaxonicus]RZT91917.1 6-phosphogluconolactonase [Rivibacter subsaxonicus]